MESPIVLTADKSLFTSYGGSEFAGFFACLPRRLLPGALLSYLYPKVPSKDGRALTAPYALRKIEAALLRAGFSESDVAVAQPCDLAKVVGSKTRVIGVTSVDPRGKSPVAHTICSVTGGGPSATSTEFESVLRHPEIQRHRSHLQVVVGGPGAWQISNPDAVDLGINCIVTDEAEGIAPDLFSQALKGERLPQHVAGGKSTGNIPTIVKAARRGHVEITRGCGRGCQFCAPTQRRWMSIPKQTILEEVKINRLAGIKEASLVTDDGLRYGSPGLEVNHDAIVGLFKSILSVEGMESVGVAHASFSSVVNSPQTVKELSELCGYSGKKPLLGPQIGLETGSVRLIQKFMCGKPKPGRAEDWCETVVQGTKILNDNYWYPCTTLILGLPEETEDDVLRTLELVDELKGSKQWLLPLFFSAMDESSFKGQKSHSLDAMTKSQWELLFNCWDQSIQFSKYAMQWLFGSNNRLTSKITQKFSEKIVEMGENYIVKIRENPDLMVQYIGKVDLASKKQALKQLFQLI